MNGNFFYKGTLIVCILYESKQEEKERILLLSSLFEPNSTVVYPVQSKEFETFENKLKEIIAVSKNQTPISVVVIGTSFVSSCHRDQINSLIESFRIKKTEFCILSKLPKGIVLSCNQKYNQINSFNSIDICTYNNCEEFDKTKHCYYIEITNCDFFSTNKLSESFFAIRKELFFIDKGPINNLSVSKQIKEISCSGKNNNSFMSFTTFIVVGVIILFVVLLFIVSRKR